MYIILLPGLDTAKMIKDEKMKVRANTFCNHRFFKLSIFSNSLEIAVRIGERGKERRYHG